MIGEWIARGRNATPTSTRLAGDTAGVADPAAAVLTVSMLIKRFWDHARTYYVHRDGTPTSEQDNVRQALRPLRRLYGPQPAAAFGPLHLRALREEMLKPTEVPDATTGKTVTRPGWSRTHVNRQVARIRLLFKWAVSHEMVPAAVHQALATVPGLKRGRSSARETDPVRTVPQAHVDAVLPLVSPQVAAMIRLQLLTGMRPSEVCTMRTGDIDRSRDVWVYRPADHKTAHHGHVREIALGPRAQEVVQPFLRLDPGVYLFSPKEAEEARRERLHAARQTPLSCGNVPGSNRTRKPRRVPRDRYDRESYRRAIARACRRADRLAHERDASVSPAHVLVPSWHPHQLRHNAATDLRGRYGIEAARLVLGHRSAAITEVYAELDGEKARRIMREVG